MDGPQQIKKKLNLSSKKGFARNISNRVIARFYRAEGANPSWPYSEAQQGLLKKGQAPDPLQQVEHLNDLAKNPKGAINVDDVYLTEGGPKGGIPKDSPHGQKNWGESGERLRAFEETNAASTPKKPTSVAGEITPSTKGQRLPKLGASVSVALDIYTAVQMNRDTRIAKQSPGRVGMAVLQDDNGRYTLRVGTEGAFFNYYDKTYITGKLAGTTQELGALDSLREKDKCDKKYGYFDWKGDFVGGLVPPIDVPSNYIP